MLTPKFSYKDIYEEVVKFSKEYRNSHNVPKLPDDSQLKPYKDLLFTKFSTVIKLVEDRLKNVDSWITHGFHHLEYVSLTGSYIAESECNFLKIDKKQKEEIIETTFLSGILHDIDRHLGYGEIHMIEGQKTAEKILEKANVDNKAVSIVVRNHDKYDFKESGNLNLDIPFGSVFDADHFMYGWEREDIFWKRGEGKNVPIDKIIHDYEFMVPLRNAWRTEYGKKVGPLLIDFGLAIAKDIEEKFS